MTKELAHQAVQRIVSAVVPLVDTSIEDWAGKLYDAVSEALGLPPSEEQPQRVVEEWYDGGARTWRHEFPRTRNDPKEPKAGN